MGAPPFGRRRPRRGTVLFAAALLLLLSPRADAAPGSDDPAAKSIIRAVLELDGHGLIPFKESYRSALVLAVNASIPSVDPREVTLVAVEEVLPEAGPTAESLTSAVAAGGGGGGRTQPPPRRALAQAAATGAAAAAAGGGAPLYGERRGEAGGSPDDHPHVHVSLALEPPAPQAAATEAELRSAVAGGALVAELLARGVPATGAHLLKLTAARSTGRGPRAGGDGASTAAEAEAALGGAAPRGAAPGAARGLVAGLASVLAAAVLVGAAAVGYVGVTRSRRSRSSSAALAAAAGKGAGKGGKGAGKAGGDEEAGATKQPASPWAASPFTPSVRPAAVGLVGGGGAPGAQTLAAPALSSGRIGGDGGGDGGASTSGGGGGDGGSGSGSAPPAPLPPPPPPPPATAGEDVPFTDLDLVRPIGEGAFGRVYLAHWRETAVAVKLLAPRPVEEWDPAGGGGGGSGGAAAVGGSLSRRPAPPRADAATDAAAAALLAAVRREAALMARLRHPHVVQYLGTVSTPPAVLSEYCPNGSVADVLARAADAAADAAAAAALPWARRLGFALGAAKGMLHLHSASPPLLHRDLKPANLLVDASWRVKVADFNLARTHSAAVDGGCGGRGGAGGAGAAAARSSLAAAANPRWVAPEVLAGGPASPAADVFSYGVVLWELLTWSLPWADLGPWQVVLAVVERHARLPLPAAMQASGGGGGGAPSTASPTLPDADLPPGGLPAAAAAYGALIRACWADDPAARPDFTGVISALRSIIAAQAAADGRQRAGRAGGGGAHAAGAA